MVILQVGQNRNTSHLFLCFIMMDAFQIKSQKLSFLLFPILFGDYKTHHVQTIDPVWKVQSREVRGMKIFAF